MHQGKAATSPAPQKRGESAGLDETPLELSAGPEWQLAKSRIYFNCLLGSAQTHTPSRDHFRDVRSANGYVLAPESIVNGKPYRVISNCGRLAQFPDWAEERLALRARGNSNEVSVGGSKRFDWDTPSNDLEFCPILPATVK